MMLRRFLVSNPRSASPLLKENNRSQNPDSGLTNCMPMLADPTDVTPYPASTGGFGKSVESDVIELPLLLPRWQVDALEDVANQRGMTTGQMIRKVISEMLRAA